MAKLSINPTDKPFASERNGSADGHPASSDKKSAEGENAPVIASGQKRKKDWQRQESLINYLKQAMEATAPAARIGFD